jgi:hypothetical protein
MALMVRDGCPSRRLLLAPHSCSPGYAVPRFDRPMAVDADAQLVGPL